MTYARHAVDILSASQNRPELIDALLTLGLGHLELDHDDAASTSGQSALDISREIEARAFEGKALNLLADIAAQRGDNVHSTEYRAGADDLFAEMGVSSRQGER